MTTFLYILFFLFCVGLILSLTILVSLKNTLTEFEKEIAIDLKQIKNEQEMFNEKLKSYDKTTQKSLLNIKKELDILKI